MSMFYFLTYSEINELTHICNVHTCYKMSNIYYFYHPVCIEIALALNNKLECESPFPLTEKLCIN